MKKTALLIIGFFCLTFFVRPQAITLGASSNEALEQRIEKLEAQLEAEKFEKGTILEKISIGGLVSGAYQYQSVDNAPSFEDTGRGAFVFQPEIGVALTEQDELFFHFGFGAGNGLNDGTSPFNIAPWAADLEDDVKDINGRSRDYLLQAWYKHTFQFSDNNSLGITGGLIDSTGYLDENAFANDEYSQFMNAALVNGPNGFFPAYDIGGALEWEIGQFAVKGVVMNVGDTGENANVRTSYNFYGAQLSYRLDSGLGEGNYRVVVDTTSEDFLKPGSVNEKEALQGLTLSFDQELSDILGAWLRLGWQDDSATITYEGLYSGGINISGSIWGRQQDNIGVGYAYLDGASQVNQDIDNSQIFEAYVRFLLTDFFALTADVQYLKDDMRVAESPDGFITGLRGVIEF
jgi:porin